MNSMKADPQTIEYYDSFAKSYDLKTFQLELTDQWNSFASMLNVGAKILDVGCGTGRDIKHFQNLGFLVDGIEPSRKMAAIARSKTNATIFSMAAEDINFIDSYDGIWACASLVHIQKALFVKTLKAILKALKSGGYLYISLKEGEGQTRLNDGRLFSYFTKSDLHEIVSTLTNASIIKSWATSDSAGRGDISWINMIIQKN
ncbi:class I SAM-dependent methyltransferase [Pseudomonas tolaasii]|nr:class I SAM-dependent methyltransferase [Pseudomonas tolaasii]